MLLSLIKFNVQVRRAFLDKSFTLSFCNSFNSFLFTISPEKVLCTFVSPLFFFFPLRWAWRVSVVFTFLWFWLIFPSLSPSSPSSWHLLSPAVRLLSMETGYLQKCAPPHISSLFLVPSLGSSQGQLFMMSFGTNGGISLSVSETEPVTSLFHPKWLLLLP